MKRVFDITFALITGLVFSPVIIVTAIMVFVSLGRPLLFRQERAGASGRTIVLLKWRSMSNATSVDGKLLADDERVTRIGRVIRRLRVDELPSVANIVRGDLSFVGPRPLPASNPINHASGGARLAVRPGLTGLAQVSGNTLLSDVEKLAVDLHYIRTYSLARDLVIIWRTILTVLRGERRDEMIIGQALDMMERAA
jgi:lipopolysaccharide/colanic/teichoic acid biosynthesis glycosyltransferase